MKQTTLLVILDGWGYSENDYFNAIRNANTPTWDSIWQSFPKTLINASSLDVGLPRGQMGNSEVGHVNIGSGRVVYQELTKIDKAISENSFGKNQALCEAINNVLKNGSNLHILGLLSEGGVHSHQEHIFEIIKVAKQKGVKRVFLHVFLDGRDTPPRSARESIEKADKLLSDLGLGYIASVSGRYYAMDRDNRWDRVEKAYNTIVNADAEYICDSAVEALEQSYMRDQSDEFVVPTSIKKNDELVTIENNDSVIFMNFRADRARELSHAFVDSEFTNFERDKLLKINFTTLTEYDSKLKCNVAFPPEQPVNTLGEILAKNHKTQLRISETEKYPHVTFFFNGGKEDKFEGEDRILIPSPKIPTYDLQPEMSAPEVTNKLVDAINSGKYDCIVCNYANSDMVGHTGNYEATLQAIEHLDKCLTRLKDAILDRNGNMFITADHGNADMMVNPETHKPHTAHTTNPVPFIYVGHKEASLNIENGKLSDIAPTILEVMSIPQPSEMTGKSIFKFKK
ncbi:2,3-bisphosphoglycerate-independent phosphoglycerate mutase [Allofrancisella guangzhouensis]|uniref:2,3-bisphosphoglycerate-independent phosphoglycerate mutase n=1 Tax=Allofrancisella guangzhouensis TaxID=594679 RepID=A0A0A8E5M0_9GAMM|nr:2,3-bisphosphoglycerate-independent phosphoglycerate mutase [Allofrancisella guangzhouensis]AJC49259.1 phosphoglyceromutase [Allofrancisella guangzhouensis]MBK2027702.1 2,3-bisphosphoglycerate-independent phosphoglycerate mutase [Allofrancisella guangzhouensis]MBK2044884.1 2,3-bisphosphoglycerate-independent phosphoglycerate mutase [Allofrancisella guangzhouensis]MBK2046409.1 2,3-bisphosphoglycerate-independent phosphoglycerate mutase [Allofrancisella guangzhouensis]